MRKLNKMRYNIGQSINLNVAYAKLKALYAERHRLDMEQDRIWAEIHRTHRGNNAALDRVDQKIGNVTHSINKVLNELSQCHKAHKVMNFAYSYVNSEIARVEAITRKWQKSIREVEAGRRNFINSSGVVHSDTTNARNYLSKKRRQLEQLRKWKAHLSHYLA